MAPGLVRATRAPFVDWVICTVNVGAEIVNVALRVTPPAATVTVVKLALAVEIVRSKLPSEAIGSSVTVSLTVGNPVRSIVYATGLAPGGKPYMRQRTPEPAPAVEGVQFEVPNGAVGAG